MQHCFFQYAFITLATLIIGHSVGRDLRPSVHGLAAYLSPRTQTGDSKQMLSFFSSQASPVPLEPEAQNTGDDTWWSGSGRSRDNIRRDHVRKWLLLLVTSAVCGTAGIVLLVVAGIIFGVRLRKRKAERERLSANSELQVDVDVANQK